MKNQNSLKKSRNTNYGFKTSLNTAVFTTSFVIVDKKPITYVTHEFEDGAWQFFSDDFFDDYEKVAKIVSLEEIIDLDPTIIDLAEMKEGQNASRNNPNEKWVIKMNK